MKSNNKSKFVAIEFFCPHSKSKIIWYIENKGRKYRMCVSMRQKLVHTTASQMTLKTITSLMINVCIQNLCDKKYEVKQ